MITFTTVFVILFFIFVLQGIWLFISELAGKDLDTFTIIKFLSFYAPTIVPLVLPLSVLLAGIMTFGSFAENYEFAAMKSSGISLQRAMKWLSAAILLLSLVSFFFANNVIPESQYRFLNLRKNIVQQRPAMAIAEGQFNSIGSITIKVGKKTGDNGNELENVVMHVKNQELGNGASTVIKAKRGLLKSEKNSNYLQLQLFDGNYYENVLPKDYNERKKVPFAKSSFKEYILNIDLTKLNSTEGDDNDITSEKMLNINELKYTIDSLQTNYIKDVVSYSDNIILRSNVTNAFNQVDIDTVSKKEKVENILNLFNFSDQKRVLEIARNNISSTEFSIENSQNDLLNKQKNIYSHWIVYHEKFMLAYSCLLMFFIGAPLGAIIRKGGIGLPMVFAVIIFIAYHFMNVFGRKLAQEAAVLPFFGTWLASIVLTPLAIFLTYRATNDIGLMISFDWLIDPIKKFFSKNKKEASFEKEIVLLSNIQIDKNNNEDKELLSKEDKILKNIVKNSDQFGFSDNYRLKTLKILEERGITQEQLKFEGNLYNSEFLKFQNSLNSYKLNSKYALFFYTLAFLLPIIGKITEILVISIISIINIILMYVFIYKSSKDIDDISKNIKKNTFINTSLGVFFGFPFYIIIYINNKTKLKEIIREFQNKNN